MYAAVPGARSNPNRIREYMDVRFDVPEFLIGTYLPISWKLESQPHSFFGRNWFSYQYNVLNLCIIIVNAVGFTWYKQINIGC